MGGMQGQLAWEKCILCNTKEHGVSRLGSGQRFGKPWVQSTHVIINTFAVCEDLHPTAEHGLEHGVLLGEGLHGGVVERPAHVQLHILGAGTGALEGGGRVVAAGTAELTTLSPDISSCDGGTKHPQVRCQDGKQDNEPHGQVSIGKLVHSIPH